MLYFRIANRFQEIGLNKRKR